METYVIVGVILLIIFIVIIMGLLFDIYYKTKIDAIRESNNIENKEKYFIVFNMNRKYTHAKAFNSLIELREFLKKYKSNIRIIESFKISNYDEIQIE